MQVGDVEIIKRDERNRALWKLGIVEILLPGKNGVVRAVRIRAGKSYRKTQCNTCTRWKFNVVCGRKDNPVSVEERSPSTDPTSRSKRVAAVIVGIALQDQVTDENDTLSSGYQMTGESVKSLPELFYKNLLNLRTLRNIRESILVYEFQNVC